ncbi:hypothetical protein LY56_03521 [Roseinatronobacter thiooxidans]|uniref:Uncharacterized protein n=1 Tax=Roseinatronobacter thiooxidans TaxID=121821 RepID=A0A2W7QCG4_9RHOB|nr:hypothetical protein [Roseinatronobacter thiooxidans]PZX36235.1 hypothetical protein LY56_03521 [Roseinatronobacter thiooxidans]
MLDSTPDSDAIARTNRHLQWPTGPGILMLDYDAPKDGKPLSKQQLLKELHEAVPELEQTPKLWLPSSSSHIFDIAGKDLTGLRGQRLYIALAEAADAPRVGEQIGLRLWAAGKGRIEISKSGALLKRVLIDLSVFQPSRFDFAAGASTGKGLKQQRGTSELILPPGWDPVDPLPFFDSRKLLPDADPELKARAEAAIRVAEEELRPASKARKRAYVRERIEERLGSEDIEAGESETTIIRAIEDAVLGPDFVLHIHSPMAPDNLEKVNVEQVLKDIDTYDGRIACDPIEPEYNGWSRTAKLYLRQRQPNLYSQARGGRNYSLTLDRPTITWVSGEMSDAVEKTIFAMKASGQFLNLGDAIVTVNGHLPTMLNKHGLAYRLGKFARFRKKKIVRGEEKIEAIDPPADLCSQLLEIGRFERSLPTLLGIARGPFIRPSGSLCNKPGFDEETGVYGCFSESDFPVIPKKPSHEECVAAHDLIWSPFTELELDSSASRTALLCAILTAPIRSAIDKSPVFASLAPDHGSAKTLVTEAIGALATGTCPPIMPPLDGVSEDEMRKRLTASLIPPAAPVLVMDNLEGYLDSRVLASFATAPLWSDRLLGFSKMETELPNRALVLMSGKALIFKEELARRILPWTIKASRQGPYARTFSFCPVERMLTRRPEIIVAVLTLIRAGHLTGRSSELRLPSYPQWDGLVRQTVLWLNANIAKGSYEDPLTLIKVATETSSERFEAYELLHALHTWSEGAPFRAADLVGSVHAGNIDLQVQLEGLSGRRASTLSSRSVGRYLRGLMDRPFHDLTLRSSIRANMCEWQVERTDHDCLAASGH